MELLSRPPVANVKLSGFQTLLILGIALLLGANAGAQSCAPVDYRPELGVPRDQGETSWCYAHTSADMVSQAVHFRVSAFDLATQYMLGDVEALKRHPDPAVQAFLRASPDVFERIDIGRQQDDEIYMSNRILTSSGLYTAGGSEDGAILMGNLKGYCADSLLPDGAQNYVEYLVQIEKHRHELRVNACLMPSSRKPIGEVAETNARIAAHQLTQWIDWRCGRRFRGARPVVPRILYLADDKSEFEEKIAERKLNLADARRRLLAELNWVLDHGRVAAIGYSAYDLQDSTPGDNDHGDHSSIVAARKMINGQCHYFVRNSWGTGCGYKAKYEPLCEEAQGGVWVPFEALRTLYGVTSIGF